ncbi:MAG: DNA polymerase III subunit gamma/tau [Candidatus Paceibacterota bacterium]
MTEHAALYRKYRPLTFAEVRDQDQVVKVLEGAIKKGDIPHALLFSGSRGTGKTTLARIFAKEIGTSNVDLYEIDAASNRGIDDIRELKEAVHTVPYESKYKVYIVDEVHMLTKEAFNALLKTLEEPPAHVIFILATTEEEKILDTILSRCQVFRFRSPSRAVLAETVVDVAKQEGFTLEPDAADLVAVAANGSFRDALGITQKVILASGDKIGSADEVASIIGAPKTEVLLALVKALHTLDTDKALSAINSAVELHVDMKLFARLLLENLRAVMLCRHQPGQSEQILSAFSEKAREALGEIATAKASPVNSHMLLRFLSATQEVNFSPLPHLPLEIAVVEVTTKA